MSNINSTCGNGNGKRRLSFATIAVTILQSVTNVMGSPDAALFLSPTNSLSRITFRTKSKYTPAFMPNPIDIIDRDFKALTRKVTAHHILLPKSDQVALSLKQSIRNKVNPPNIKNNDPDSSKNPMYVVDAFSLAAKKYSRDDETAPNGGLLGTLAPQGYCRAPELDRACFEAPLGQIYGPIESEYGYHLLLVTERTNCPKLDGKYRKIKPGGEDGTKTVFVGDDEEGGNDTGSFVLQQLGLWIGVAFAGGIVAEVAAKTADVIESVPWE